MACKSPIYAYQHREGGRLIFKYNPFTDKDYVPVTIPCGQCIECRKQKQRVKKPEHHLTGTQETQ